MKILVVNSKEHWINGWMTSSEKLDLVLQTLKNAGCEVKSVEVQSISGLDELLQATSKDTLVWPNAYLVNGEDGKQYNLIEQIEKYNLPLLGSDLSALLKLLEKDRCQEIMNDAGIPVPAYLLINDQSEVDELINSSTISFPVVIKPTKESRSQGIVKVDTKQEAIPIIAALQKKYPESNIIVEEFLPGEDVTCGFLKLGDEIMLLPSYIVVDGMDCSKEIFSEEHYKTLVNYAEQEIINDSNVLHQLEENMPMIVDLLGIGSATRIDARLDKNGTLKFFDVNGMPGLNYPASALIKQCFIHFPNYLQEYLFGCLINTIVLENLLQNDLPIPSMMKENHLFNLESTTVLKTELFAEV